MSRAKLALAATLIATTAGPAVAGPWRIDSFTINPGTFHSAVQFTETEDYALVVECHEETGRFEIFLESPFDWEPGASYAPEVPTTMTIDGVASTDVMFHFDERQLYEGIVASPDGQAEAFGRLLDALSQAGDTVTVSYFDKQATFSAEGLSVALLSLGGSCL